MTLFPYLQLQVEGTTITTVPPELIQSFNYISRLGPTMCDMTANDPTFTSLEELLILSDTGKRLYLRFGYLDEYDQINSPWLQARLVNFSPQLTTSGMLVTANFQVDTNDRTVVLQTRTFEGKISRVAAQVANLLGCEAEIEETNDDYHEGWDKSAFPLLSQEEFVRRGLNKPQQWRVRNKNLLEFLKELAREAYSKSSVGGEYNVFITGASGRSPQRTSRSARKPILHFHTPLFKNCIRRANRPVKSFTYLVGETDEVIEFRPEFNSSLLGKIGVGNLVIRAYDPVTGKWISQAHNAKNLQNKVKIDKGNKTTATTINPDNPQSVEKAGGIVLLRQQSPQEIENVGRTIAERIRRTTYKASLTLVGLPTTTDLEANDLINVSMLVPDNEEGYKVHWSSGTYIVEEAAHRITTGSYTIECQLFKSTSTVGKDTLDAALLDIKEKKKKK
jgi:hypothetical protein